MSLRSRGVIMSALIAFLLTLLAFPATADDSTFSWHCVKDGASIPCDDSSWSSCTSECNFQGQQYRTVKCGINKGNGFEAVEDSECEDKKPAESQHCMEPCTGSWECYSDETRSTPVSCFDQDCTECESKPLARFEQCVADDASTEEPKCNNNFKDVWPTMCKMPETCTPKWYCEADSVLSECTESSWSACTGECGIQTRVLKCGINKGSSIDQVEDSKCAGKKPDNSKACETELCTGEWKCYSDEARSEAIDCSAQPGCTECESEPVVRFEDCVFLDSSSASGEPKCNNDIKNGWPSMCKMPETCTPKWYCEADSVLSECTESSWSACPECGTQSAQTRVVKCGINKGSSIDQVEDSKCEDEKPDNSKACETKLCTGEWKCYSDEARSEAIDCSAQPDCTECESKPVVRFEDCVSLFPGLPGFSGEPTCNDDEKSAWPTMCKMPETCTPKWYCEANGALSECAESSWSSCTGGCGSANGTQTRDLKCGINKGSSIAMVEDSECEDEKPSTSQTCETEACTGEWKCYSDEARSEAIDCSAQPDCTECESTSAVRFEDCAFLDSSSATGEPKCSNDEKNGWPSMCKMPEACTPKWYCVANGALSECTESSWSTCPGECGTQSRQHRTVKCGINKGSSIAMVEDSECADDEPATSQTCETEACTGEWKCFSDEAMSEAIDCSAQPDCTECESKDIDRYSRCPYLDSSITGEATCNNDIKSSWPTVCKMPEACTPKWFCEANGVLSECTESSWSSCTGECGSTNGTQTRVVKCGINKGSSIDKVEDSECEETKLDESQACETEACTGEWKCFSDAAMSEAIDCSAQPDCTECESTSAVRFEDCAFLDSSSATGEPKCNNDEKNGWPSMCKMPETCTPKWYCEANDALSECTESSWSSCTGECGTQSTQTRVVKCGINKGSSIDKVEDSECEDEKPSTSQTCNTEACTGEWKCFSDAAMSEAIDCSAQPDCTECESTSVVRFEDCVFLDSSSATGEPKCNNDEKETWPVTCKTPETCFSFSWKLVPADSCVSPSSNLCADARRVAASCQKFLGNTVVENVDDSNCDENKKPVAIACDTGIVSCGDHGKCDVSPFVDGEVTVENVFTGSCKCVDDYSGFACDVAPVPVTFDDVSADFSKDYTEIIISWDSSGTQGLDATVSLHASLPSGPSFEIGTGVVGANNVTIDSEFILTTFQTKTITITVTLNSESKTSDLEVPALCEVPVFACDDIGGKCNTTTGMCDCNGDYSGSNCSISPCDTKGCNPDVATCKVKDFVADCDCPIVNGVAEYSDDLCYTPASCSGANQCKNGGFVAGKDCDGCVCAGNWSGDVCAVCSLDSTCNNGVGNDDCSACKCNPGYYGEKCTCRDVTATFLFTGASVEWFYSASASVRFAWNAVIAAALKDVIGDLASDVEITAVSKAVVAKDGRQHVNVVVSFIGNCLSAAVLSVNPADTSLYAALTKVSEAFESGELAANPAFAGLDTDAGLGLHDAGCDASVAGNSCPASIGNGGVIPDGVDPEEPKKKSSGLSDGAIAGIVVGCVVGGLLILILILAFACGWCCFGDSSKGSRRGKSHTSVEMSAV